MGNSYLKHLEFLAPYMCEAQAYVMRHGCLGEERSFFIDKIEEMAERIRTTPTYQSGSHMVFLHYFHAGGDWYITELGDEDRASYAFGYAVLSAMPDCAETGGISITELVENGVELDLHFKPRPLSEIIAEVKARHAPRSEIVNAAHGTQTLQAIVDMDDTPTTVPGRRKMSLNAFIEEFGDGLLDAVREQNPPVCTEDVPAWNTSMQGLLRQPFTAQRAVVQAICQLLLRVGSPAGIINGEMGTGKTLMGIACATVLHHEGYQRCLVIAPPHLVYKWRREIIQTVPKARVWILNGSDTLRKLLQIREMHAKPEHPEFFILGRVRMRMGFSWQPAFMIRTSFDKDKGRQRVVACSSCGEYVTDSSGAPLALHLVEAVLNETRCSCQACGGALWTLTRGKASPKSMAIQVREALVQIPSIGPKRADRLLETFGEAMLADMLADNIHNFINLMDANGELIFSDRQATRMERYLGNNEVSFGQGGYQPTEFIKRQLPRGYFGCLLVDEGHEYKNEGSAQGQAMGVLASQVKKVILLTGTLMGGYADDLFHLLYRLDPGRMKADGFSYNKRGSIGPAAMGFMREHGVLIDTYKRSTGSESRAHRTARGDNVVRQTSRGPGFGPKGIMRYVVPITAFLKLKDIDGNVLPPYTEEYVDVEMTPVQRQHYDRLERVLKERLKVALRAGDHSLLGVVLNALLAWPDCAFRPETVRHPHKPEILADVPVVFAGDEPSPKEQAFIDLCRREKQAGRRVLAYSIYSGTRDTLSRLKFLLERAGLKVAILRATVDASQREDWVADQVERGVDVLLTNPELVKTGLDLLEFPTIVFLQVGYNVYTLLQASRRSWRIGQKLAVMVYFMGYARSAQMACLKLMGQKIVVSQSTSGEMPESGLDVLNQGAESIEVALARQLIAA